jgi:hypothetical protein
LAIVSLRRGVVELSHHERFPYHCLRDQELSKLETHADRGIDVALLEEAGGQPVVYLVEHHAKIGIPFWCKSPIHCGRNRIIRPGSLRVPGVGAEHGPSSGCAEKRILDVMVIAANHIRVIRDGVFRADPHDLQNPVTKPIHAKRRMLIFVLLNAWQARQTKSPETSVKAVCGSLGAQA